MTKAKQAKAMAQFKELEASVATFKKAIAAFKKVYNTNNVDLDGWASESDDVMFDIQQELQGDEE
jgi:hypothetical protein